MPLLANASPMDELRPSPVPITKHTRSDGVTIGILQPLLAIIIASGNPKSEPLIFWAPS